MNIFKKIKNMFTKFSKKIRNIFSKIERPFNIFIQSVIVAFSMPALIVFHLIPIIFGYSIYNLNYKDKHIDKFMYVFSLIVWIIFLIKII